MGETQPHAGERERLVRILSGATFLIFVQAFMVAPLLPRLAEVFAAREQTIGLSITAYMLPYGTATLVYGPLSDRIGRRRIVLASLVAFVGLTAATATAGSAWSFLMWRLVTGLGASGVVPLALALVGRLYSYNERGKPLGWLFGAMAGGMAVGSTAGVILEPAVGWRALFVGVAVLGAGVLALLVPHRHLLGETPATAPPARVVMRAFASLLSKPRALRTYLYVLVNATFHSGVYSWLGVYFARRYGVGEIGIGLALLGYGVPGFLLGPVIGAAADRWGRRLLVPIGLAVGALAVAALAVSLPIVVAAVMVMILSLGYDMTQPLFAGIVTSLDPERAGQAMGLNVFSLFTGFGVGSAVFGTVATRGFTAAFLMFALGELLLAVGALWLYRGEMTRR
jgi:predicted MFS family arabinose efflux permease